jgi:hypothetical protein
MWASIFTIAVAASVCLSAVNLASEMKKIQEVRHSAIVEHGTPSGAPAAKRATDGGGGAIGKTAPDPGA